MAKRSRRLNTEDVIELLEKDDDALESYSSDPDEPVMSGSDDEFSDPFLFEFQVSTCQSHSERLIRIP